MTDPLVLDGAARLFADHATTALVNAAEDGEWPQALWRAIDAAGFFDALAADGDSRRLASLPEALAILRAAGRHAVPLPIAETMMARWLMETAGQASPITPLAIAPVESTDAFEIAREGGGW